MGSEAKFKVGDRVRRTKDKHMSMEVGDTATVKHVDWCGGIELSEFGGTHAAYNLELVTPKPTFKVGDRVRVIDNMTPSGSPISQYSIGDTYVIERVCSGRNGAPGYLFNGHYQYLEDTQIEHAPLVIEAGKFYMTRDGRRVGPLAKGAYDLYGAPQADFSSTAHWYGNGRCLSDGNKPYPADLISEAPAPAYTANAAAEVDNQADDYGGGKSADSNLSVTITADTSELDAEIDRVKKRLKKLAKRARKLGISLDYSDLREAA